MGFGSSLRPDTGQESWSAMAGMSTTIFNGPLYFPTSVDLLIVKLPPGSAFFPEVTFGTGLAPWGRVGPHAALMAGGGVRLGGVMAQYGGLVGIGLGPVQIDAQLRRGWQSYSPSGFRSLTLQVSIQSDFGEL